MKKHAVIEPGTVFGYLTVVNHLGSNKHGQAMYGCACTACGKGGVLAVPGYKLRRGEVKSCGCKRATLRALARETAAKAVRSVAGAAGKGVSKTDTLHQAEIVKQIDAVHDRGLSLGCPDQSSDQTVNASHSGDASYYKDANR